MKSKVRLVPIAQLILDSKNANKGTERGRELLEQSLGKYGAGRSVLVDRHNRVIGGNKTVEPAAAAGMKSIAVIETTGNCLVAVQRGDRSRFSARGTHLCAAENTGRRCFAMEIEPAFVAVALERLAEMALKPKLVSG